MFYCIFISCYTSYVDIRFRETDVHECAALYDRHRGRRRSLMIYRRLRGQAPGRVKLTRSKQFLPLLQMKLTSNMAGRGTASQAPIGKNIGSGYIQGLGCLTPAVCFRKGPLDDRRRQSNPGKAFSFYHLNILMLY
jgi:hypothetical protein